MTPPNRRARGTRPVLLAGFGGLLLLMAAAGFDGNTFFVGVGAKARIGRSTYLVYEISPRTSGYNPGDPAYAFGIEKRVGGHVFQLNFNSSRGTTFGQVARGASPGQLYFGFNLGRKFF